MPPSIHPVDLIAALRHKHLTPAIVFLTSRTWDLDKAREVHPDGYVVKPYQPVELLDIVGRLTAPTWVSDGPRLLEC